MNRCSQPYGFVKKKLSRRNLFLLVGFLFAVVAPVVRDGDIYGGSSGIATNILTLDMDGVYPAGVNTSTLRTQVQRQVTCDLPIRLGIAVADTINRLVGGDVDNPTDRRRVANILSFCRYGDLYHLVVDRP